MMKEAEDFREEDEKNKENRDALNSYEETLYINMQSIKEQRLSLIHISEPTRPY